VGSARCCTVHPLALSSGTRHPPTSSGAQIVGQVFHVTQVVSWDQPFVSLPDREAAALYLRGRGLSEREAERRAAELTVPMTVTKRGLLIWARART